MKKSHLLLILSILVCGLLSCKKSDLSSAKSQYPKLIVGTWKSNQQNIQIYDLATNVLLRDSTINFTAQNAGRSWLEIYNTDGSAYVTSLPAIKPGFTVATTDTTSYLHYSILGSNLTLKQDIGGSETKPILLLTLTDMGLQRTFTSTLNATWGLGTDNTYKVVQNNYYTRQ